MRYLVAALVACAPKTTPSEPVIAVVPADAAVDAFVVDAPPPQIDRDGDDDLEASGAGALPASGHFVKVGAAPLALQRICDLTPLGDALFAAHANSPLGSDGATISRYAPEENQPFTVAFDWNRRGQPARGGGAGQGFLRVHAIDRRLFVADADPPYNGLGIVERGTEGYVFASDERGGFAAPRSPNAGVPVGAGVVPRAYHVIDVVKFRGALFASTGSVPPKERAWRGPSPGALHRANADRSKWIYEVDYPNAYQDGVWRLTYLARFRDRLYAGIQDYDGREPNDFLIIEPPADATTIAQDHVRAVKVVGGANTLRWWADPLASPPRLYWIAMARDGVSLRFTTDGESWTPIAFPTDAGRPADIRRFRDGVVVLTEHGLWRLVDTSIAPIARVDNRKTFVVDDLYCAPPLAVFRDELYAGAQVGGALWKLVAE